MSQHEFMEQADELVNEFLQYLKTGDDGGYIAKVPGICQESPLFDFTELAKFHRKIWLQWARKLKSKGEKVPDGHLVDYHRQTESHQTVQRRQAAGLFALGYQACLHDKHPPTKESEAKLASVKPTKRSTVQAFTATESRILIAGVMALAKKHLKGDTCLAKGTVDGLLAKLEVLADINLDHVQYFELEGSKAVSKVKPKWKKQEKKVTKRKGLGHLLKKKV